MPDLKALRADMERRACDPDNNLGCYATSPLTIDETRQILDRAIAAEAVADAADAHDVAVDAYEDAADAFDDSDDSDPNMAVLEYTASHARTEKATKGRVLRATLAAYRATKEQG